ncbi:MAG: DUF3014 domain-containing protein [Betaproteobacteria bacterium]|nr:DUF3014 domain-containing protein [Betaproteobacteria bacterium]
MKKTAWILVGLAFLLGGGGLGYFFWQHRQLSREVVQVHPSAPAPAQPAVIPSSPPPTLKQELIEPPPAKEPPLPALEASDRYMLNALASLIGNSALLHLFDPEGVINHIVATVDNLPRRIIPAAALPVESPQGEFLRSGSEEGGVISPDNAARYMPYMKLMESVNPAKAVALYVRLYPLFQKAYVSMGYPGQYFNDRLQVALNDLLDAPEISGAITLVHPKVFYLFADPDLEKRSAGQKLLMRIGLDNERKVKAFLREFRQDLSRYLREVPAPSPLKH